MCARHPSSNETSHHTVVHSLSRFGTVLKSSDLLMVILPMSCTLQCKGLKNPTAHGCICRDIWMSIEVVNKYLTPMHLLVLQKKGYNIPLFHPVSPCILFHLSSGMFSRWIKELHCTAYVFHKRNTKICSSEACFKL